MHDGKGHMAPQAYPLGRHNPLPGQTPPPWIDTPLMVNEQEICILLECILVLKMFHYETVNLNTGRERLI